jgi:hypothetical protein
MTRGRADEMSVEGEIYVRSRRKGHMQVGPTAVYAAPRVA